jgi:peptidyl-prolyl cis-trans isomerase B (cyclophilin B)
VASSNKRERELARARHQAWLARRHARAQAGKRRQQIVAAVAALVVLVVVIGWFALSHKTDAPIPVAADSGAPTPVATASSSVTCATPVAATKKTQSWKAAPADTLVKNTTYTITLQTNCGNVVIQSLASATTGLPKAPNTVNSQLFLTGQGFFNASSCFRLTTTGLFVLQCGSPTNDGQGGPGYKILDENLPTGGTNNYPVGTVAMANSGANTNGSQFFLVYKNTALGPNYTIWGKIVSGLDVLQKVAAAGANSSSGDGTPVQPLVITKATAAHTAAG